jgi:hypothetical protein
VKRQRGTGQSTAIRELLRGALERAAGWDLFAEVIQPHDADQLARSLIRDYEGSDRSWRNYARTFLTAILRQLHRVDEHDLARLYYLLIMAPVARAPAQIRRPLCARLSVDRPGPRHLRRH